MIQKLLGCFLLREGIGCLTEELKEVVLSRTESYMGPVPGYHVETMGLLGYELLDFIKDVIYYSYK